MWVGISRAADHGRFGFEVAFGEGGAIVLVGTEEIGEENYASVGVILSVEARGWVDVCVNQVGIVIGIVAIAGGLEGGDFRLGSGSGSVTTNRARSTEGKASEDADDGDNGEEFDEGEGRLLTPRSQSPDQVGVKTERGNLIWELAPLDLPPPILVSRSAVGCFVAFAGGFEMRNSEFENREG